MINENNFMQDLLIKFCSALYKIALFRSNDWVIENAITINNLIIFTKEFNVCRFYFMNKYSTVYELCVLLFITEIDK